MKSKLSTIRVLLSLFAMASLALSAFADTIRLKDGSLIKGTIVNFADGRFIVAIGEGSRRRELSLSADEIASIEFDARPAETSYRSSSTQESRVVPVSTKPVQKVITTDSTIKDDTSRPAVKEVDTDTTPAQPSPSRPTSQNKPVTTTPSAPPVGFNVRVLADNTANGWTNSGFVVKKGQRIRITAAGSVSLGKGQSATPSGLPDLDDPERLLKGVPTGALLAVIGDDNNDFIYIGSSREFTAGRDGALYLGLNEGNLSDNSGTYSVKVEIDPQPGS
jgi:hypothetical protein